MESLATKTLGKVRAQGRTYFEREENFCELNELQTDPTNISKLVEGLNLPDTGLKQPCTILAIILKIGKRHPRESVGILERAIRNGEAPVHYLSELIYKISKKMKD